MFLSVYLWISIATGFFAFTQAEVQCPGGQYECPDGTTCCKLTTGGYGCCPMPLAVCCSDHEHCCPNGTQCDLAHGRCKTGHSVHSAWVSKFPATERRPVESQGITCPDHHSTCPGGSTCCSTVGGQYACCPLPQAVCCRDHIHCCPHATTCNLSQQRCDSRNGRFTVWSEKFPAITRTDGVICPDGGGCPTGSTCCRVSSGRWGCCPLPKAVCCSDHIHCCPHATTCDTTHSSCTKSDGSRIRWFEKTPSLPIHGRVQRRVLCPDSESTCPDATTCCRFNNGWGCCPYSNGVCCSDRRHCCPHGTHCDPVRSRCIVQGSFMTNMTSIFGSNTVDQARRNERRCLDGNYCPSPGTCCRRRFGLGYTCCRIPNGVCCNNHCCPKGYRCGKGPGHMCIKDAKYRPELRLYTNEDSSELFFFK